jgi:hypothetical protein
MARLPRGLGALYGSRIRLSGTAALETAEALAAFPAPDFALREVTTDRHYTGGWLVKHGLPQ